MVLLCFVILFQFIIVNHAQVSTPNIEKIGQYEYTNAGGWTIGESDKINFLLKIGDGEIGAQTYFTNGSHGTFIVNETNDPSYVSAISQFQNGVSQQLWLSVWVNNGGGGIDRFENSGVNTSSDLMGFYIDRVEIEVYSCEIWFSDGGTNYSASFAFVFYGYQVIKMTEPVPNGNYDSNILTLDFTTFQDNLKVDLSVNSADLGTINSPVNVQFNKIGQNNLKFEISNSSGKVISFEFHIYLAFDEQLTADKPNLVGRGSSLNSLPFSMDAFILGIWIQAAIILRMKKLHSSLKK